MTFRGERGASSGAHTAPGATPGRTQHQGAHSTRAHTAPGATPGLPTTMDYPGPPPLLAPLSTRATSGLPTTKHHLESTPPSTTFTQGHIRSPHYLGPLRTNTPRPTPLDQHPSEPTPLAPLSPRATQRPHPPESHSQHAVGPFLGHRVVLAVQLAERDGLGVDGPHLDLRMQARTCTKGIV